LNVENFGMRMWNACMKVLNFGDLRHKYKSTYGMSNVVYKNWNGMWIWGYLILG